MTTQIKRHIVTKGNLGFVAAGTPVFVKAGKRIHYNVAPGQLVAFLEPKSGVPVAIDPDGVTAANVNRLRIGVGYSTDGVTVSELRYLGVEKAGNCDVQHASVSSPKCGNPAVKDFYFKCVDCDSTYTIVAEIDNNFTRSFAPFNASYAQYYASYVPNCKECGDCDGTVECSEIAEGLVENMKYGHKLMVDGKPYPDYIPSEEELPFGVHVIHPYSDVYCLAFNDVDGECEKCTTLDAIAGITLLGGDITPLVGTTTGDGSLTARVQLESVVDQINDLLETTDGIKGHAYLTGVNASSCCPLQLHVNYDVEGGLVLNDDADDVIAPTTSTEEFAVGTAGEGYTCGIRIIAAPITGDCDCLLDRPLGFYGTKINIDARGDGFKSHKTADIQKMELPGGFGRLVQWHELEQTSGGSGRDYAGGGTGSKYLGGPRDNSRWGKYGAVTADCDTDYCSYYVRSKQHFHDAGNKDAMFLIDSYVHVPSGDTVTSAAVKAMLEKWATLSINCDEVPTLTCVPLGTACA